MIDGESGGGYVHMNKAEIKQVIYLSFYLSTARDNLIKAYFWLTRGESMFENG